MSKLKVCVIGIGNMANAVHLPSLVELDELCDVVALCDLVEEKAKAGEEKFGIPKVYTDYEKMLREEKPDGVYVLVEPDRMFRIVWNCLNAGVHVFTEKPAGISAYQAESMARCAQKNGKIAAVGMNRRFIPLVRHVIERMNELTTITQVNGTFIKNSDIADGWFYTSAYICDIIHAIDLVRHIAAAEPTKAATVVSRLDSPVDNAWSSVMRFENGIVGMLQANYRTGGRVHSFEIHGATASAFINLGFGEMACEATILHSSGSMYSASAVGTSDQYAEHIDGKEIAGGTKMWQFYGHKSEAEDFLRSIIENRAPLCPMEDAAGTMRMVEMLMNSSIE